MNGTPSVRHYSLRPILGVPVEFGKCEGKLLKKDSGMWVLLSLFFFVVFRINRTLLFLINNY